jgi:hypothetical protein
MYVCMLLTYVALHRTCFFCVVQYKVCYNQVVAEVREDTEEVGAFVLPNEPLMETCVAPG